MATTLNTRIYLKSATSAEWANSGLVLGKGEYAFDTDNKYIKVGDGTKAFRELSSIHVPVGCVDGFEPGDIDTNTIYDLSVAEDGTALNLISADGTLDDKSWALVKTFTAKSWADEIEAAIEAAKEYADGISSDLSGTVKDEYVPFLSVHGGKAALTGDNTIATMADVAGLSGCIHFIGIVTPTAEQTDKEAILATYPNAKRGDIVVSTTSAKEYICTAQEQQQATAADWIELGDETAYVKKTTTVNGKALTANIELSASDIKYDDESTAAAAIASAFTAIGDEITARTAADEWLSADYNNTISAVSSVIEAEIAAEAASRAERDDELSAAISAVAEDAVLSVKLNGQIFTVTDHVAELTISCINCGGATA